MLWNKYLLDNKKLNNLIEEKEEDLKILEKNIYLKKSNKKIKEDLKTKESIKKKQIKKSYLKNRLKRKKILKKIYNSDYRYNLNKSNIPKIELELNKQKYKFKAENWKKITPILLKDEKNLLSISKVLPKLNIKENEKEDFNNLIKNMRYSLLLITEEKLRLKIMMEEEIKKNLNYVFFKEEENKELMRSYIIDLRKKSEMLFFIDTLLLQLEENELGYNENYQFNYHQLLMDRDLLDLINERIDLDLVLDDYDNIIENDQEDIIGEMLYLINKEKSINLDNEIKRNISKEINKEEQKEIEYILELERFY